ncbi:MCE family protein [Streptomyces polyrhachis]|uniref:MCE family protein n=1 Tax=Streptomyces polyrhachis TaxID=1282885 RepID=A0ABW2GHL4_9ACTN
MKRALRLPRWRRKPLSDRNPLTIALIGLVLMTVLGLTTYNIESIVGSGTTYTAEFSESAGLRAGDEVRVAGVKVGKVETVALDGAKVRVSFTVKDAWVGADSRVGIAIATLLGSKYLALDPLGSKPQDPDKRIPLARTSAPYDVMEAFNGLSTTVGELDSAKIAMSLDVVAETFKDTPPAVRKALAGMSALSQTFATRNTQFGDLLANTRRITTTMNSQSAEFERLLKDGNLLLGEVRARRQAIHNLLVGARSLSTQLIGLVRDNETRIGPALDALDRVTKVLVDNQANLDKALSQAGAYYRLVGNTLGNGRWLDGYICGLVPNSYQAPGQAPVSGCMPPKIGGRG